MNARRMIVFLSPGLLIAVLIAAVLPSVTARAQNCILPCPTPVPPLGGSDKHKHKAPPTAVPTTAPTATFEGGGKLITPTPTLDGGGKLVVTPSPDGGGQLIQGGGQQSGTPLSSFGPFDTPILGLLIGLLLIGFAVALRFIFKTVFTTKMDWSGPGDERPEESIQINYSKIEMKYQDQDGASKSSASKGQTDSNSSSDTTSPKPPDNI